VDQFCEVYFNNKKMKEHIGGYLPFSVELTNEIITGENILILKVSDKSDTSYHSRGKQKLDRGGYVLYCPKWDLADGLDGMGSQYIY
jgi:hypothetical protein